ncbi:MAG TPA: CocE/NonD family hydrolase [Rhizomicrobium sp.]|nr:CocE/NonD family hydrolase [Rhizomicrobium sp.]
MRTLAAAMLDSADEKNRITDPDDLFRVEIVAGRYAEALRTLKTLEAVRATSPSLQMRVSAVPQEIFVRARLAQAETHLPFADAYARVFHDVVRPMGDRASALVMRALNVQETGGLSLIVDLSALRNAVANDLTKQAGKHAIAPTDALKLARDYELQTMYAGIAPFVHALVMEDDDRRYIVEPEVAVKTPDGAIVCALVVRPRGASPPLTTLMEFSIYADLSTAMSEARRNASNGYAGVAGFSRGKLCSPGQAWPIEHDGADADALIDWIARQPWSDGRVGMFGGSYDGFAQWAAAKHMPKALKALMPSVTMAPGIDMPTEGSVYQSFDYYWPFYVATNKTLNGKAFEDRKRWNKLFRAWYVSGKAYRDLDKIDGVPNPVWDRWVDHPAYDAYWQAMIPYEREFAHIDIPVLTTTGYYDGGQIGATYYLAEQYKYLPHAEHYLVIGPYDHGSGNRGTINVMGDDVGTLDGYRLDPAAHIDLGELRYQWFAYVFRHGPKPAILQDKINYEVMGANLWRHAPSLAAMADQRPRFFLSSAREGNAYKLAADTPKRRASVALTVNMADRTDADRIAPGGDIDDSAVDTWNSLEFVGDPIAKPLEMSGLFSGHLDFISNKKDFDFIVQFYERTAQGRYFELSTYMARASFVGDRRFRRLLMPGVRTRLDFTSERLTSRLLQSGSRIVVLLGVFKQPNIEINYGSGKPVGDETIADAGAPLRIDWFNDSYLAIPQKGAPH